MIRAGKLNHAAIRVADVDRSRAFYEQLLGMRQAPRPDIGFPGTWYELGEAQLHLIQIPKHGGGIDPADPHIAVEVDDFEAAKRELAERGIEFVEFVGALWIRDPDGYTVELRAPEKEPGERMKALVEGRS
jgi:glyoxylase I family protein